MTFGHVVAPARATLRRRLAVLLPLAVGLVVGAILWRAGERRRTAQPAVVEHVCAREPAPSKPSDGIGPPHAEPGKETWHELARCLREGPVGVDTLPDITVQDVHRWVNVEHDPMWLDNGYWWLPLSGEGDRGMPSGLYVAVPLEASAPCRSAIIN